MNSSNPCHIENDQIFYLQDTYRLPSYIVPITYDLLLSPNIETGDFSGRNRINVNVTESTNKIFIHSHLLNITTVVVEDSDGIIEVLFRNWQIMRQYMVTNISLSFHRTRPG